MNYFRSLLIVLLFYFSQIAYCQVSQTVRGRVVDKITQMAIPGANIILTDSGKFAGTSADINGFFRIEKVPVGRKTFRITCLGYKELSAAVLVHSAKETVLHVEMEESVITTKEVVVSNEADKNTPLNKMASVSAHVFTVEETNRYAGSMNDPARMAKNFAGVMGSDETRNEIIIRGNSPFGLLWRLDEIDIPNPNHFSSQGTTGGPISILNNNTLSNSDFFSAAFPSEYGNALSGVFDLKMKTGNNEKLEFTGQLSINGLEFGAEGPLSKSKKSSYLIHYRYADFTVVDKLANLGISGVPKFQDVSFKLNFPLKNIAISVTGIAGSSDLVLLAKDADTTDLSYNETKTNTYFGSDMATLGITLTWFMSQKMYSKFILSSFYDRIRIQDDTLGVDDKAFMVYKDFSTDNRVFGKYLFNRKMSSKLSVKAGLSVNKMMYQLNSKYYNSFMNQYQNILSDKVNLSTGPVVLSVFNQWLYKVSDAFTINSGFHVLYFDLNKKTSLEPRAGVSWEVNPLNKISFGYGLHSKLQPLITYLSYTTNENGEEIQTNKNLDFTKAHHFVFAYDRKLNEFLRLKSEVYYQQIYNVPVESALTSFSMINTSVYPGEYKSLTVEDLQNNGTGQNYGIEFTLERFFNNGYYYMSTLSLFSSTYKGSDGINRNTQFNSNYIFNFLLGKEVKLKNNKSFFVDFKAIYAGGKRYTPIDVEKSILTGETIRDNAQAFSKQYEPYWKGDLKIGIRIEGNKFSQEIAINADNFTNHKNILWENFNTKTRQVEKQYQFGIMPGGYYRIYF